MNLDALKNPLGGFCSSANHLEALHVKECIPGNISVVDGIVNGRREDFVKQRTFPSVSIRRSSSQGYSIRNSPSLGVLSQLRMNICEYYSFERVLSAETNAPGLTLDQVMEVVREELDLTQNAHESMGRKLKNGYFI